MTRTHGETAANACRDLLFALLSGLLECHWQQAFGMRSLWSRTSVVNCVKLALGPRTAASQPYHLTYATPPPAQHAQHAQCTVTAQPLTLSRRERLRQGADR